MAFIMKKKENTKNKQKSIKNLSQKGFSILELLAAMVIFLIVSASIYGLLRIGTVDRNRATSRSDILKNARIALHLIGRDAFNAGLGYNRRGARVPDNFLKNSFNVKEDADNTRDLLTAIISGDNLFGNTLLSDPNVKTDMIAFCTRDMDYNKGNAIEIKDVSVANSTTAVVETTLSDGASAVNNFNLFLLEAVNTQVAVIATGKSANTVSFSPAGPLGLNQAYDGVGNNASILRKCTAIITEDCTNYSATSMYKFDLVSYRIKEDGTLVRTVHGNNTAGGAGEQLVEQSLAYNIEDMQISYVLESGEVTDKPTAGSDNLVGTADDVEDNNNFIRQINVMIKVQSTDIDEKTRKPLKITLNATYSARNLEYDAK
jgi:prepilin-type N-terminal cleavage/methylation domain-containing protein